MTPGTMRLVSASQTDAKTGLLNAATFAMLDIDHFKKVNDAPMGTYR